ncbi:cytochrome P450 [Spirilliplanes yamanashiensis]|uniref:Fatty-acid peroxygenase n=1 Tax=Spirilliplanes yamanashiensis TaxID=42233 RepID=A0A8J3YDN6_9ACTN|nr:cytochrome P450 [Spirilliplanes yamanashiensis]MDP9816310.1 fatty-acid peroxygenase [Spirilliplanes yamanashiensis]GIJ05837.1 fatty-acid peroxygenase [Spirilliplanes yamanashiensis]
MDDALDLALNGYAFLPDRRRARGGGPVPLRLAGLRATALCGPDAVRFFYDEAHVRRSGALPEPLRGTLFGKDSVHSLDGAHHRRRKHLFVSLLTGDGVGDLVRHVTAAWDDAAAGWDGPTVLIDEAARVVTRGVCAWTGVPDGPGLARDLTSLVDGFATAGPRHWRARRARGRLERRFAALVERAREHPGGTTAVDTMAWHREADGRLLPPRVAAVELLNVIRPTVAICWFVAFAAHALTLRPELRPRLADEAFATAFTHEVRRFYPFAPFVGGRAVADLEFGGVAIPRGSMVLLDLWGQNHDATLWPEPFAFRPERFVGRPVGATELIPQGGGDPRTGHRCPGEQITVAVLTALVRRLAALDYDLPPQDLGISLRRIPARPADGVVVVPRRAGAVTSSRSAASGRS